IQMSAAGLLRNPGIPRRLDPGVRTPRYLAGGGGSRSTTTASNIPDAPLCRRAARGNPPATSNGDPPASTGDPGARLRSTRSRRRATARQTRRHGRRKPPPRALPPLPCALSFAAVLPPVRPGAEALSVQYPDVFAIPGVTPGVNGFIPHPLNIRLFPKDRRVVLTTLAAGGRRRSDEPPLATVVLDDDAFRAPLVDLAELHVLNLVAPPTTLDHVYHSATPFPTANLRCSAALLLLQLATITATLPVVKTHLWGLTAFLTGFNQTLNLLSGSRYREAPSVGARSPATII